MGNSFHRSKKPALEVGLDVNVLLVTSYSQMHLARVFKYSLDDKYPMKSDEEKDKYAPVMVHKNVRIDEKKQLDVSISISRRVSVYNTDPYYDYFLDNIGRGFNYIILLYDSSSISVEDYQMAVKHLQDLKNIYNSEWVVAIDFNMGAPSNEIFTPRCASTVITKIPRDKANFADKLLDRIFNLDIIVGDMSMSDMPSVSAVKVNQII